MATRRFSKKPPPPDPTYVTTFRLPTGMKRVTEVEVNAGDLVRVLAHEGRRDGFDARAVKAKIDPETGALRWVDVVPWKSRDASRPVTAEEEESWKRHRKPVPAHVRSMSPDRVRGVPSKAKARV